MEKERERVMSEMAINFHNHQIFNDFAEILRVRRPSSSIPPQETKKRERIYPHTYVYGNEGHIPEAKRNNKIATKNNCTIFHSRAEYTKQQATTTQKVSCKQIAGEIYRYN